jgi:hypothetical protein
MRTRRNREWMAAFLAAATVRQEQAAEGVGTGAGGGDDPALTEATSWVNRSVDCPEAPAQAHPLRGLGRQELAARVEGRRS